MFITPGIQTKLNTQALPAVMYARPDHWVVTRYTSKGEQIAFGRALPLSKKAGMQYLRNVPNSGDYRVKMRKTAMTSGLIAF